MVLQTGCGSLTYGRKRRKWKDDRQRNKDSKNNWALRERKEREQQKDKNILKVLQESNKETTIDNRQK